MVLTAQFERCVLGNLPARLVEARFAGKYQPGHHERLRSGPAFDEAALDEELIEEAIRREVDRGGQVFYVHNRVQTIEAARRLIETLCDALRARGSTGVHLGVGRRNQRAIGFYRHVGFAELESSRHGLLLGMPL